MPACWLPISDVSIVPNSQLNAALARLTRDRSFAAHLAAAGALERSGPDASGLPPLRIAILRNFTVEPLLPVLQAQVALAGFHPTLWLGDFDAVPREALDPASPLYTFAPDYVLLAQWLDGLSPALARAFPSLSLEAIEAELDRIVDTVGQVLQGIRARTRAPILINNFPLSSHPAMGALDAQSLAYQTGTILRLNQRLLELASTTPDVYIVDYLGVLARIGSAQGADERRWHSARAPLARQALLPIGSAYGTLIRALRGKARKCLVLDCDNTLWGGIVGEDGLDGIQVGETGPGAGYRAFQREVLNLKDRGVIIALCSKNNEADVLEVLRTHSGMLIRETDIVAMQVNWDDKATNLRRIADQLNIGLDSLVFVDDNGFECDLVRSQLPEVAVVQLPENAADARALLAEAGYFDTLTFSAEDRRRSEMYRAEAQRRALQEQSGSLEGYLAGLGLVAAVAPVGSATVARVAQLTQKTNQFNLTTRRYGEGEIAALASASDSDVFSLTLRDKIADLGIVGVAIVRYNAENAEIDSFLMSCRALGRGAEEALLAQVLNAASARGCAVVVGRYLPTAKNGQVADFYPRHGFRPVADAPEGAWQRPLDGEPAASPPWITTNFVERPAHAGK